MSILYELDDFTTIADTELNSLANATGVLGKEFDNGAVGNLDIRGLFQLTVTFGSAPTAGAVFDLYLVKALDGSTFEDGSATIRQDSNWVGAFVLRAVTTIQIVTTRPIQGEFTILPAEKFKMNGYNASGQAFPATGSTIKFLPYRFQ